ncbi:MAG: hypothetical protein V5A51_12575 [Bacteroidales bacterium]
MGQEMDNVPKAFEELNFKPKTILLDNKIKVPTTNGHLQGIQYIEKNDEEKLLISGSSHTTAYIIQADIDTRKVDKLIPLMSDPYRHAGGIQATSQYVIAGIEDNYTKRTSRVCIYNYLNDNFYKAHPDVTISREGEPERKTAGATGLLAIEDGYLAVIGNWDSRNWDFYHLDLINSRHHFLKSFNAPDNWPGYQSINLIKDKQAIYAVAFYKKEAINYADLILISKNGRFKPVMEKVCTKRFHGGNGADFGSAAGLHVDKEGNLHIWSSQKDATKQIAVSRFSQR